MVPDGIIPLPSVTMTPLYSPYERTPTAGPIWMNISRTVSQSYWVIERYLSLSLSLSFSLSLYIYIYRCITYLQYYVYIYIYIHTHNTHIYIYIYRERERKRETYQQCSISGLSAEPIWMNMSRTMDQKHTALLASFHLANVTRSIIEHRTYYTHTLTFYKSCLL